MLTQIQRVTPSGTNNRVVSDGFGVFAEISNTTAFVSSVAQDFDGTGGNSLANAGAMFVFSFSSSSWNQTQKITPTGTNARIAGDNFGSCPTIHDNGTRLLVASSLNAFDATGGSSVANVGALFAFNFNGSSWTQTQKITPSERISSALGGGNRSIAISGTKAIVGAYTNPLDFTGGNSIAGAGAAYIFHFNGSSWTQAQKITPSGTNARILNNNFGYIVDISGTTAILGVQSQAFDATGGNSLNQAGAAFAFNFNGSSWTQAQKIIPSGTNARVAGDGFGSALAISGTNALISSPTQDTDENGTNTVTNSGAVFAFTFNGSTWTQIQKFVPSGTNSRANNSQFGGFINITGNTAYISSKNLSFDETGGSSVNSAGSVFTYIFNGSSWTQDQRIVASGTNARNNLSAFGQSVKISGTSGIITANGAAFDSTGGGSLSNAGAAFMYSSTTSSTSSYLNSRIVRIF